MTKVLALAILICAPAFSDTYFYSCPGCALADASDPVTPGVFSTTITVTDPGFIPAGDAITVSLFGFHHTFAGDLSVSLIFDDGNPLHHTEVDLFNRILLVTPFVDFGCACQFGDGGGLGENYHFNSAFLGDIWTVATPLGSSDSIPGESTDFVNFGQYWTTTALFGTNNNASSAFAGLPAAGDWTLVITDYSPDDTGFLEVGWSLNNSVPEPDVRWLSGLALIGLVFANRLRKNRARL